MVLSGIDSITRALVRGESICDGDVCNMSNNLCLLPFVRDNAQVYNSAAKQKCQVYTHSEPGFRALGRVLARRSKC
jgi:hypothetical protein